MNGFRPKEKSIALVGSILFPEYSGVRCLMMPYIQGEPDSVPDEYVLYREVVASTYINKGDIGYLTIDESPVAAGSCHRGARAKFDRALHTEAGLLPCVDHGRVLAWGGSHAWSGRRSVLLDPDVKVLLANNLSDSCAFWEATHHDTSFDGDIGDRSDEYPYRDAVFMQAGEVYEIGVLTPHESLPVKADFNRQFLRIVGSGVHGRESYFTENPLMATA